MAEEITTTQAPVSSEPVSTGAVGASEATTTEQPNFSGLSSTEIAEMLTKLNQPGGEPEAKPEGTPQEKPQIVPQKFLNPDGTPNIENLAKSYAELEKSYGRAQNSVQENAELKSQIDYMNQVMADMKASYEDIQKKISQPQVSQTGKRQYTEEELDMIQNDPGEFVKRELARELETRDAKLKEETRTARLTDYEMFTAVNKARSELPGFKSLEPEISKIIEQPFINQHPDAIKFAYDSLIGKQMPQITDFVRNEAYKKGYEQAKNDLSKQVEGGGRDTSPVSLGGIDINGATSDQLGKILPRHGI
jgi:hypothetical protein